MRQGALRDLQELYAGRITPRVTISEVEEKRPLTAAALKSREGELILAAIPSDARLIALDQTGKSRSSREFASDLSGWRDDGVAAVAFAIGGAEGLAPAVLDRAASALSLGAMTWPHLLARCMLLEQIYRAQQIAAGHPYHRE